MQRTEEKMKMHVRILRREKDIKVIINRPGHKKQRLLEGKKDRIPMIRHKGQRRTDSLLDKN